MRAVLRSAVVAVAAVILLHAERAWAPFHEVVVDEVFFGTADCPNAQYVQMRILISGMRFIANQRVRTENADGSDAGDFGTFAQNVDNGAAGDRFIMGTADAAGLFGIAMDEEVSESFVFPDGRVCFGVFGSGPVDCVAYGNFTGDNTGGGDPAVAPQLGMALMRQGDDRFGDDATDFVLAAPAPRNNNGDMGTLGQCPGQENTPTPTLGGAGGTPTPSVTATAVPTGTVAACIGDCGGDGVTVEINELIIAVNIALGNAPLANCPEIDLSGNGSAEINELITAVNNALNGCPA